MTAVEALWLPLFVFGAMWLAAIPLARLWQLRSQQPNPYMGPWSDRAPGDLDGGDSDV